MVKLLYVYGICTGMYVMQAKQPGNHLGRRLVHETGLKLPKSGHLVMGCKP